MGVVVDVILWLDIALSFGSGLRCVAAENRGVVIGRVDYPWRG